MTNIEWTDDTWNPIVGCSVVSPGCTNCYAMKMAARLEAMRIEHYRGLTWPSKAGAVWTSKIARAPEHILTKPLRWKNPRKIFVNSMGDLFHESVPDEWIDCVFAVTALCPRHIFQVPSKRMGRVRRYFEKLARDDKCLDGLGRWHAEAAPHLEGVKDEQWEQALSRDMPLSNVWLGASVEDQPRADERREHLQALAAMGWTTFVSYEPALGPVDWTGWEWLSWLISGGETGPKARPSHPGWHRAARDFCAAHGIAYFFKKHGVYTATPVETLIGKHEPLSLWHYRNGVYAAAGADGYSVEFLHRVGAKRAGRQLDGRIWEQMPSALQKRAAA